MKLSFESFWCAFCCSGLAQTGRLGGITVTTDVYWSEPRRVGPAAVLVYMLGERTFIMIGGGASGGEICPNTTEVPNAKQVAQTRRQRINPSHRARSVPGWIGRWQRSQHIEETPFCVMLAAGGRIPTKVAAVLKLERPVDEDGEWYASPQARAAKSQKVDRRPRTPLDVSITTCEWKRVCASALQSNSAYRSELPEFTPELSSRCAQPKRG